MPNPTVGDVHVDRVLTNISIAHMQASEDFVADQVFANIPTPQRSNIYYKYDRADFNRAEFKIRAPGTESAGGGWKVTTDNFFIDPKALHKDVEDQARANQDSPLDLNRDAAIYLTNQAMITKEVDWASRFFTTGVWTGAADATGNATPASGELLFWSSANSTPINDVAERQDIAHLAGLVRPNVGVAGAQTFTALKMNTEILDRINRTSSNNNPAMVTRQAIAALFELEELYVARGIQVTSKENPAFETSMTTAWIAGRSFALFHRPRAPGIMNVASGYTFSWEGYLGASSDRGLVISNFRMQHLRSDRIEGELAYVFKVVAPTTGAFFSNIVAPVPA